MHAACGRCWAAAACTHWHMCILSPTPPLLLPCSKVPGVGKVTQKVLARFGVHTGADLLEHRGLLEVRGWSIYGASWVKSGGCLCCGLPASCMHASTHPSLRASALPASLAPPASHPFRRYSARSPWTGLLGWRWGWVRRGTRRRLPRARWGARASATSAPSGKLSPRWLLAAISVPVQPAPATPTALTCLRSCRVVQSARELFIPTHRPLLLSPQLISPHPCAPPLLSQADVASQ